jgi:hypothetical protein
MSVLPEVDGLRKRPAVGQCRLDHWLVGSRRRGDVCVGLAVLSAEDRVRWASLWLSGRRWLGRLLAEKELAGWIGGSLVVGRGGLWPPTRGKNGVATDMSGSRVHIKEPSQCRVD